MDPVGHPGPLGGGRIRGPLVSSTPVLSWAVNGRQSLALSSFSKEAALLKSDHLLGVKLA